MVLKHLLLYTSSTIAVADLKISCTAFAFAREVTLAAIAAPTSA